MRSIISIGAVAVFSIFLCAFNLGAADIAKIGIIDAQRVLETSVAGKAVSGQLKGKLKIMSDDLKQKGQELEELGRQLERESMVMSQEKRQDKERERKIKMMDFQNLEKRYRSELKQLEKKLMARIQKDILKLSEDIGKKGGYLLIVNKLGVMYAPQSADITDSVIETYNAMYAKGQAEASKND